MPIRDMSRDGRVAFLVDVYGVIPSDLAVIGGDIGSAPMLAAVLRLGLDPHRFQAWWWDLPIQRERS